jgi:uracil-DNA glycosylase family 4
MQFMAQQGSLLEFPNVAENLGLQEGILPSLNDLAATASHCTRCQLSRGRTQAVFSDGNPQSKLVLIGEGPGQNEDETGIPFVGKAGQLLTKILESVGIDRKQDIYICNTVKCRPPQNRAPEPDEMAACRPYLDGQMAHVQPKLILLAGSTAVKSVLQSKVGITKLRGQWFPTPFGEALAMPIFHPSYLLRNASKAVGSPKWLMWQDVKAIKAKMDELGLPVTGKVTAPL